MKSAAPPACTDEQLLARVTWSLIAEPDDAAALSVRSALGEVGALEAARTATPGELHRALGGSPGDGSRAEAKRSAALETALARWRRRLADHDPRQTLELAGHLGIRLLTPEDEAWPERLHDLGSGMPACLWIAGDAALAGQLHPLGPRDAALAAAIVGSRTPSPYGRDTAFALAAELAARGITIVSGGAFGIDAAAHHGALGAEGPTVAILAGGLDQLYPRSHGQLLRTIAQDHLLITEAPPGRRPTRWRFLARNRLIAALSDATVVVQATWRSGALSTAGHADDLSRPVAAVPGEVTDPASAGCHRLIRERGAVLVTDAQDVLELLPHQGPRSEQGILGAEDLLTPADHRILSAVPPRSRIVTERISEDTGESLDAVRAALGRLEVLGLIDVTDKGVRRVSA